MASSKQLPTNLKVKIISSHTAREGFKIAGTFPQFRESLEDTEIYQRTACTITRKTGQNLCLSAEDLQKDLADTGVVVNRLTDQ